MFMRAGRGGQWNFTSDVLCELFEKDVVVGIKEEHSDSLIDEDQSLNLQIFHTHQR